MANRTTQSAAVFAHKEPPTMKLRAPYNWLAVAEQPRAFVVLLVVTIAALVAEQITGAPLKTDAAPSGIVSFELAGTLPVAQGILASWDATARVYAGLNLGLDFLFIAAYATCIGLGCVIVVRNLARQSALLASVGVCRRGHCVRATRRGRGGDRQAARRGIRSLKCWLTSSQMKNINRKGAKTPRFLIYTEHGHRLRFFIVTLSAAKGLSDNERDASLRSA
jgi:hypothetical protein